MCTDTTYKVPSPPDLEKAQLEEALKKKHKKLNSGMDPKVLARINSGIWKEQWREEREFQLRGSKPFTGTLRPDARKRPLPGTHPEHPYECLVFKGGGAKGSIYPGAIKALEDAGVMPYVKRFAGASAGSLVAALLAAGLTADQLFLELALTDLQPIVLDSSTPFHKINSAYTKFGLHPGNGLYQHIGMLFYKYLGCADVTFKQLYDMYGVELAVTVTNISRASVELLHVKTAPDYPIRKAVRASMSLPVALHPCRDRNIHNLVSERVSSLQAEMESSGEATLMDAMLEERQRGKKKKKKQEPTELYVDGGVLLNYPIDCFDGWWLSMEKEDAFFRQVVGEGGHKNYVERFGRYDEAKGVRATNPRVMGFRLASAWEPDAMHSRLGNDALELRVRKAEAATLPESNLAMRYAPFRFALTSEDEHNYRHEKNLREAMTWIKKLRDAEKARRAEAAKAAGDKMLPPESPPAIEELARMLPDPPGELLNTLSIVDATDASRDLAEMLRNHHFYCHGGGGAQTDAPQVAPTRAALDAVLETDGWASKQVKNLYQREMPDAQKLHAIQLIVRGSQGNCPTLLEACDELEELLEVRAEKVMRKLCGMDPKKIYSLPAFVGRMIEAIQMTNDEKVQTKENYSRTCMLNTEYVGTMDFKLEDSDHYFLWRKGYLSTLLWLEKRTSKAKDKKKKVAKSLAGQLKEEAKKEAKKEGKTLPEPQKPAAAANKWAELAKRGALDYKAKVEKTLANPALSAEEKLDIIQRLSARQEKEDAAK